MITIAVSCDQHYNTVCKMCLNLLRHQLLLIRFQWDPSIAKHLRCLITYTTDGKLDKISMLSCKMLRYFLCRRMKVIFFLKTDILTHLSTNNCHERHTRLSCLNHVILYLSCTRLNSKLHHNSDH